MKIDTTQVLKDYEGLPIYGPKVKRDNEGKTVRDKDNEPVLEDVKLTLRSVITDALLYSEPDKVRTAEDKNKADQINRKIWAGKETNLTVKEMGFISEKVAIFFNPLVMGRVDELLEGSKEEKEEKAGDQQAN